MLTLNLISSPFQKPNQITGDPSVYPRVCGGTACQLCHVSHTVGLSPRVRGNLDGGCHQDG